MILDVYVLIYLHLGLYAGGWCPDLVPSDEIIAFSFIVHPPINHYYFAHPYNMLLFLHQRAAYKWRLRGYGHLDITNCITLDREEVARIKLT